MKWLFALLLACAIFGGAYFFASNVIFKQEIAVRQEQKAVAASPPEPTPDLSGPEFEAAMKLKEEGKLPEAREALTSFLQRFPNGGHFEAAKDALGEVNGALLFSHMPTAEKQEYIVKKGDVINKVAQKMKTTPELIVRMNNLSSTMLHIGEKLYISHPEFSIFIQTQQKIIVLLNHGNFFKQYHIREVKLPAGKQASRQNTRVAEVMAWKNGKRVGLGTKEYQSSTRWIRLGLPAFTIYALPDAFHPGNDLPPPAAGLGISAADAEELSSLVNAKTPVTITE